MRITVSHRTLVLVLAVVAVVSAAATAITWANRRIPYAVAGFVATLFWTYALAGVITAKPGDRLGGP